MTYKITYPNGKIEYSDIPPNDRSAKVERVENGRVVKEPQPYDHSAVTSAIKTAQRRVFRLPEYLQFLAYLRDNFPNRHIEVMMALKQADPKAWEALKNYPEFQQKGKAGRAVTGVAAGLASVGSNIGGINPGNALSPSAQALADSMSPNVEGWLDGTLQNIMKRDGYPPYTRAMIDDGNIRIGTPRHYARFNSGLPTTAAARAMENAMQTERVLSASRLMIKSSVATAASRMGSPVFDLLLSMSEPDRWKDGANFKLNREIERLMGKGVLTEEEASVAQGLLSQQRYQELYKLFETAIERFVKG